MKVGFRFCPVPGSDAVANDWHLQIEYDPVSHSSEEFVLRSVKVA